VFNCSLYCVSRNCFACTFATQLIKLLCVYVCYTINKDQSINQSIKMIRVCKTFFMHTLAITDRMTLSTMSKLTTDGRLLTEARECPDARRVAVSIRDDIRSHIGNFPTVPSHYCRKNSNREYLSPGLSLSKM